MPMVREFFTKDEINAKLSRMYAKTEITFFLRYFIHDCLKSETQISL
jgi:hypothetical protein